MKAEFQSDSPVVVRFRNEAGVTLDIVESQSRFADQMRKSGIATPRQYQSDGAFAKWYAIDGYDVIVTVEEFAENELKVVDAVIAGKTGELLAKMHNISEKIIFMWRMRYYLIPFPQMIYSISDRFRRWRPLLPVANGSCMTKLSRSTMLVWIFWPR